MKLYKIIVLHGAPKDSHTSIEGYLVADYEVDVFDWIDKKKYGSWSDQIEDEARMKEEDEEFEYEYYLNDDWENPVPFKEYVMAMKGDLEDDNGWDDAYYGVTKYGWEEIPDVSEEDIETLLRLGIAEKFE